MIQNRLAFALRLVDDFTGKKLGRTECSFKINGRQVFSVYKEEGFYLFFEPMESFCHVEIETRDYFPGELQIHTRDIDPAYPAVEVRLCHRPRDWFPYRCSLCCGKVEPDPGGKPFMVYGISTEDSGLALNAFREAGEHTILELSGYSGGQMEGCVFGLGEGKNLEVFVIREREGMNEYRISEKIKKKHKKGERLFRIYRTYADGDGNYVLPVKEGCQNQIKVVAAFREAEEKKARP